MLHTQFQDAEPGEEDFYVYFTCKPWNSSDRTIMNKLGKGPLDNAIRHTKFLVLQPRGSKEDI